MNNHRIFENLSDQEREWIDGYLNDTIESESFELFQKAMTESADLRKAVRRAQNMTLALRDAAMESPEAAGGWPEILPQDENTISFSSATTHSGGKNSYQWMSGIMAIAALLVLSLFLTNTFINKASSGKIAKITGITGVVKLVGDGGSILDHLQVGDRVSGGTFELQSPDASIELRFADETTIALSGLSLATVSENQRKEIHLKRGNLSADVVKQPDGRDMIVHTPAADMQVLGTQFNVSAQSEKTQLVVNHGVVKLKRVSDGQEVPVEENHSVTASLETLDGLHPSSRPEATLTWKSALKEDVVYGKWAPDYRRFGIKLEKAVASGTMTKEQAFKMLKQMDAEDEMDGGVWALPSRFGSLIHFQAGHSHSSPVNLTPDSTLRIQGRAYTRDMNLEFGITTNKPHGGYSGKLSHSVTYQELNTDDYSFTLELPVSDFIAKDNLASGESITHHELASIWCVSQTTGAKFEITSVELIP